MKNRRNGDWSISGGIGIWFENRDDIKMAPRFKKDTIDLKSLKNIK